MALTNIVKDSFADIKKGIARFGSASKIIVWSGARSSTATTTASTEGARTLAIIAASTRITPNISAMATANIVKVSVKGMRTASASTQPGGDGNRKTERESD